MTLKQFINQEQAKHKRKRIGDEIALQIIEDGEEVYFEEGMICEGEYDYFDLIGAEVITHRYEKNYGGVKEKLKLVVFIK